MPKAIFLIGPPGSGKERAIEISLEILYNVFMLTDFINKNLKKAKYKLLRDGTYFAEIPGIKGVWANAKNLEDCRKELQEVLEGWILLKIKEGERVPGFEMKFDRRSMARHA